MSLPFLLLAAQASGIAMNLYQTRQAAKQMRVNSGQVGMAAEYEKEQLGIRMQQEQLISTEQSLIATDRLREVLATSRAMAAVRGNSGGAGTPQYLQSKSVGNFNMDQLSRDITQSFKMFQLKSQKSLIDINKFGKQSQISSGIQNLYGDSMKGLINQINTNEFTKSFTGRFGVDSNINSNGNSAGYNENVPKMSEARRYNLKRNI